MYFENKDSGIIYFCSPIDSDVTSAYNQQISFVDSTITNNEETKAVVNTTIKFVI